MTATIKPSEVYVGISKQQIKQFLCSQRLKVIDFRIVRTSDLVLFYNSGKLNAGLANPQFAGYIRYIVAAVKDETGVDETWE